MSVYAQWEQPTTNGIGIYADASMHRILSDLSAVLSWRDTPVLVAGDFNSVLGAHDDSFGANWTARNTSVFSRFNDLGLFLAGPQHPNGRQAEPRPTWLPADTRNVPTFTTSAGNTVNQLDYCYVTADLLDRVAVTAHNDPVEWGPSDHCRISIEIAPPVERTWTEQSFADEIRVSRGTDAEQVVRDLFAWAHEQSLRLEFNTGRQGQVWAQLDDAPTGLQYTFSVRTAGDVVVQFQFMSGPYRDIETREMLRRRLNEIEGIDIPEGRLTGRPAISLRALVDPAARAVFLAAFTDLVTATRTATP